MIATAEEPRKDVMSLERYRSMAKSDGEKPLADPLVTAWAACPKPGEQGVAMTGQVQPDIQISLLRACVPGLIQKR